MQFSDVEALDASEEEFPLLSSWSDAKETLLKKLQEEDIELSETALGRERLKLHQQLYVAYLQSMTEEDRAVSNLPAERTRVQLLRCTKW